MRVLRMQGSPPQMSGVFLIQLLVVVASLAMISTSFAEIIPRRAHATLGPLDPALVLGCVREESHALLTDLG